MTPSEQTLIDEPTEERFFTKEIEAETKIRERGYRLIQLLGEGGTRRAYLGEYKKNGVNRLAVIKIPLEKLAEDNATAQIFKERYSDLEKSEIAASNRITSEHITKTYEAIPYCGRSIIIEEYFPNATSLEDRLEHKWSKPNEDGIRHIATQLVNALEDLHQAGFVHKDIKPANILVGKRGLTKLTDLQTTRNFNVPVLLPTITKGGTKYTHPEILNAMLDGHSISPKPKHDIYSLGATLYKALTGEDIIDLSLVPDDNGTPIQLSDNPNDTFKASLLLDGTKDQLPSKRIPLEKFSSIVKKRLRNVPPR